MKQPMAKVSVPFSGAQVSRVCLGTHRFGVSTPEDDALMLMDRFFELGGNFLDTARVYGDFERLIVGISERLIGRWLRSRGVRGQVVIATKGGHPPFNEMWKSRLNEKSLREDAEASLEALGVPQIDLYYLHRDDEAQPVGEIMAALNTLVAAGWVRALGASNWTAQRIEAANAYARAHGLAGFVANEPQWSLARSALSDRTMVAMDEEMFALHARTNMLCMPFSAQAQGFFTKLARGGEAGLDPSTRAQYLCAENLALYEQIQRIAGETGLSVGAIALHYLTGQAFPVIPIVGPRTAAQMDALAGDVFASLAPECVARLNALRGFLQ